MPDPHGEHHRCARCEAVGRAEAEARVAALTVAIAPTHSMPRHQLPPEWQEHIRKIQQAALDAAGGA